MKTNCNNLIKKVFLALIVILTVFSGVIFLMELCVRIVGYQGEGERLKVDFKSNYGDIRHDPWFLKIDPATIKDSVSINGKMFSSNKKDGVTRIIFLGDSGTFIPGKNHNDFYPHKFEMLLKQNVREKIEIINAGFYGMHTVGEYLLFKNHLYSMKPNVVVLGLFMGNDIQFNLTAVNKLYHESTTVGVISFFRRHSALFHFVYLRLLILNAKYRIFENVEEAKNMLPAEFSTFDDGLIVPTYDEGTLATYKKKYGKTMKACFDVLTYIFEEFINMGEALDFQFVVILLPTQSAVVKKLYMPRFGDILGSLHEKGVEISESDLDVEKPIREVMKICEKIGIICINPLKEWQELGLKVFGDIDNHPSSIGANSLGMKLSDHFDSVSMRFIK